MLQCDAVLLFTSLHFLQHTVCPWQLLLYSQKVQGTLSPPQATLHELLLLFH